VLLGSNFWLSHKKEKSPLTHGLNYRSACDGQPYVTAANLVLFNIVTLHSCATQFTVDWRMNVLDVGFKVIARNWLVALLAENYVALAVYLVDHEVALSNISLATGTKVPITKIKNTPKTLQYTKKC